MDRPSGMPEHAIEFTIPSAANGYFGVMGIPIVRGREFTPSEVTREGGTAESVAIVGVDVARRLWGAADPIGRRLRAANDSVAGPRNAVVAFSVRQRTGEIAVRMAVGARGHQIVGQFVGDGLRLSAFGLVFGLPASLIGLRLLSTIPDFPAIALPPVTAVAASGIFLVATAAVWIPARHAASVDPAVTLRRE